MAMIGVISSQLFLTSIGLFASLALYFAANALNGWARRNSQRLIEAISILLLLLCTAAFGFTAWKLSQTLASLWGIEQFVPEQETVPIQPGRD